MLADVVLRSLFPEVPTQDVVERFRSHLRETGEPESFPEISTSRPPADGHVVPLAINLSIPGNRRARGNLAPCPICSAKTPKWASGGTLIWCEQTKAIYAIGPDCYSSLWADGRLDREINRLRRTLRETENLALLRCEVLASDQQLHWIESHRDLAERVSTIHDGLARAAPRFRGAISRTLKGSLRAAQQLAGHGFVRGVWKLPQKLDVATHSWLSLRIAAGSAATIDELSPSVVAERLAAVRGARSAMQHVYDRLAEASAFLSPQNIQTLAKWGASADAPITFNATHTGARVRVTCDSEFWEGPIAIAMPKPLP